MSVFSADWTGLAVNAKSPLVAVAVSGGADSLALMVLMAQRGLKPIVLTVDHGMRPESKTEAAFVADAASALGLEHHTLSQSQMPPPKTQAEARALRYQLLAHAMTKIGASTCALAHQQQDQAETFLFRLHRGSGLAGLAAMEAEVYHYGARFVRPLLRCEPQALKDFLKHRGLRWCEDPSNVSPLYMRTHLGVLVGKVPFSQKEIAAATAGAAHIKKEIAIRTLRFLTAQAKFFDGGFCTLKELPPENILANATIARLIEWTTGVPAPRTPALQSLCAAMRQSRKAKTLGHCHIIHHKGKFYFFKERERMERAPNAPLWDNRFRLAGDAAAEGITIGSLDTATDDDMVTIAGIDSPIPKIIRPTLPALFCDGRLVAVPHLGWGAARHFKKIKLLRESPTFAIEEL